MINEVARTCKTFFPNDIRFNFKMLADVCFLKKGTQCAFLYLLLPL